MKDRGERHTSTRFTARQPLAPTAASRPTTAAGFGSERVDHPPLGTVSTMSNDDEVTQAKQEAADNVVERVQSWHEGAEPHTVEKELREGFEESEVQVDQERVEQMAQDVHDRGTTDSEHADPR